MSRYEEEQGSLILPSAALVAFRKSLVTSENSFRTHVLEAAAAAYDYLTAVTAPEKEGKPGKKLRLVELKKAFKAQNPVWAAREVASKAFEALDGATSRDSGLYSYRNTTKWDDEVREKAAELLIPYPPKDEQPKLAAPKKKNLAPLVMTTSSFSNGECSVTINAENRSVNWDVEENNHAVEHAWASRLGRAFDNALSQVKWTRATGGVFRKRDEYGDDAAMEHGGNPIRISRHFGPLGEQIYEQECGFNPRTRKVARGLRR